MGDWIEWHGGENPVPGQMVQIKWRDNSIRTTPLAKYPSDFWGWANHNIPTDIIAYRLDTAPDLCV